MDDTRAEVEALREEVRRLETELDARRSQGVRGLLRVTERHSLPAAIAALQALIETLEVLRALLRAMTGDRRVDTDRAATLTARLEEIRERVTDGAELRAIQQELEAVIEGTNPDAPEETGVPIAVEAPAVDSDTVDAELAQIRAEIDDDDDQSSTGTNR
jgi:type VI protein secretion system component VasK